MVLVASATRIDGCPGALLGPFKTPADNRAFASIEPREDASAETGILSPPPLSPSEGEGRAAGEKECQDRGSKDAKARCLVVSVDGPRHDRKSNKMPEWGLT